VNRVLIGGGLVVMVALGLTMNLLLRQLERNGTLEANLDMAITSNHAQAAAREALAARAAEILAAVEAEREAAERALESLLEAEAEHEIELSALESRLAAARGALTDEQKVCAEEIVPAELIDALLGSLHTDAGYQRARYRAAAGIILPADAGIFVEAL
jgi:chromosome segregation ATPase